jgi:hypothetical protein
MSRSLSNYHVQNEKFNKSIEKVCTRAKNVLSKLEVKQNSAIVFDIDDTLIYSKTGYLIKPVYDLYKYATNLDITPFIVTARISTPQNINYTKKEMANHDVQFKYAFFRCEGVTDIPSFKLRCRERITSTGYSILMTVGDMNWDISGGYNGIGIKIPS